MYLYAFIHDINRIIIISLTNQIHVLFLLETENQKNKSHQFYQIYLKNVNDLILFEEFNSLFKSQRQTAFLWDTIKTKSFLKTVLATPLITVTNSYFHMK